MFVNSLTKIQKAAVHTIEPESPSICFIVPYFDEKKKLSFLRRKRMPEYFEHFLATFCRNKKIHLKIITNVPTQQYQRYCYNGLISFHHISLRNFFDHCKRKMNIQGYGYDQFRAYKICDFKPMFGVIFSDLLRSFDYWGYCDIDMVIGNLDASLGKNKINEFDMIWGTSHLPGYMALYKNHDKMNYLFQKSPDYLEVVNSPQNYLFDEYGNGEICAMGQVINEQEINVNKLSYFIHNDCGPYNKTRKWKYLWKDGKLTDEVTGDEIGALHLVTYKKKKQFTINGFQDGKAIFVDQTGISFHDVS